MAHLAWQPPSPSPASSDFDPDRAQVEATTRLVRRLIWKLAIAAFILMAIGSATRVMNAGLACPDWPLCYGTLIPVQQMNLQVFLEWFHRLDAGLIGLMALGLAGLCIGYRQCLPSWLPWAAVLALALVIFQAVLGGLTVTELLRFDIVTAHLGTALLFFVVLLVMGSFLLPYEGTGTTGKLPWLGLIATIAIYAQSLLGALVSSQWALHKCLSYANLCPMMHSHIGGLLPTTGLILTLVVLALRTPALHPYLRRLARLSTGLLFLQAGLGFATFYFHLQVEPLTIAHQAIGAALLGTLAAFTVLAWRDRQYPVNRDPQPQIQT